MSATTFYMPRHGKPATTTVRVDADLAAELEVIAEYLEETVNRETTIGSLIEEWVRPHLAKHRQKAIDYRIEKLKRMKDSQ